MTGTAHAEIPYYNEACANCGVPADLHKGPGDQPSGSLHISWGDVYSCRNFARCDPPRAAYGTLPGVDHRELLRKYIAHAFANGPDYVVAESAAVFVEDSLKLSYGLFTAEEKAELARLAGEEAE